MPVHLNRDGGEQFRPEFDALNPQHLVPVLDDKGIMISQSIAIIEYLEEAYPDTPLLPRSAADRARVRQLALAAACEIHPLNNLRVLKFLTGPMGLAEQAKQTWIEHWTGLGLSALESELAASGRVGRFCFGDTPTMADCCLVPQLFNAARFGIDLTRYPTLLAIDAACQALPAFQLAHPARQPDSE
jgi:maleylpyruvate isomerase